MPTNYPGALDNFTNPSSGDQMNVVPHADQHANANDAIEALQAKVGVDSSAATGSIDYLLRNPNSFDPGHRHTLVSPIVSGTGGIQHATSSATSGTIFPYASVQVDAWGHVTSVSAGTTPAAASSPFVTVGNDITLTGERSLIGTADRITFVDNGANSTYVANIASSYVGQTSITTLGTVTTGTWNGTAIGVAYGGTNQTSYASGDILYASAATTLSKLAIGADGYVLKVSGGLPSWSPDLSGSLTGAGSANALAYWSTSSVVTGSNLLTWTGSTLAVSGDITLGPDTQIYRNAADVLRTPDRFQSDTAINVGTSYISNTGFCSIKAINTDITAYSTYYDLQIYSGVNYTNSLIGQSSQITVNASANTIAALTGSRNLISIGTQSGDITSTTAGSFDVRANGSSGTITNSYGINISSRFNSSNSKQVLTSNYGISVFNDHTLSASGSIGSEFGLRIRGNVPSGGMTNRYGVYLDNYSASGTLTNNYALYIADQSTGTNTYAIYLAGTSGLPRQGISWNGDTNLFRSAANTLRTDNNLIVGTNLTVSGSITVLASSNVGTVTGGTWNGSTVQAGYGGTGHATASLGDILVGTSSGTWARLTIGTSGQVLKSNGSTVSWEASGGASGGINGGGGANQITYWTGASTVSSFPDITASVSGMTVGSSSFQGINTSLYVDKFSTDPADNVFGAYVHNHLTTTASNANNVVGLFSEVFYNSISPLSATYALKGLFAQASIGTDIAVSSAAAGVFKLKVTGEEGVAAITQGYGAVATAPEITNGSITRYAAFTADNLSLASHNIGLLLGTITIPSTSYAIYSPLTTPIYHEGQLQLPGNGSTYGLTISDTQLYRNSADVLRTPDSFYIDSQLGVGTAPATTEKVGILNVLTNSGNYNTTRSLTYINAHVTGGVSINGAQALVYVSSGIGSGPSNFVHGSANQIYVQGGTAYVHYVAGGLFDTRTTSARTGGTVNFLAGGLFQAWLQSNTGGTFTQVFGGRFDMLAVDAAAAGTVSEGTAMAARYGHFVGGSTAVFTSLYGINLTPSTGNGAISTFANINIGNVTVGGSGAMTTGKSINIGTLPNFTAASQTRIAIDVGAVPEGSGFASTAYAAMRLTASRSRKDSILFGSDASGRVWSPAANEIQVDGKWNIGSLRILTSPTTGQALCASDTSGNVTFQTVVRKRGLTVPLCGAYTPAVTGGDSFEFPMPYSPIDGTTSITWVLRRINLRVSTNGGAPAVTIEKSTSASAFSATTMGSVTMGSSGYETFATSGFTSNTIASGNKLRMRPTVLGTATNWTVTCEFEEQ